LAEELSTLHCTPNFATRCLEGIARYYRRGYTHTSVLCTYSLFSWPYNGVLIDQYCESGKASFMLLLSNVCRQRFESAIMKFLGFACLAVLLGVSSAAEQMEIGYYADSGCDDYVKVLDVTWASESNTGQSNCFNYNLGNEDNGVGVANCNENSCWCYFYEAENCASNRREVTANSCLSHSYLYKSFSCYYS
jgi:hypothetical protein